MFIKGLVNKFASFNIVGDCNKFRIHGCLFDSQKDGDGHYTFYGLHIMTDTKKPDNGFHNSPRNFRVYDNVVRHTRYDGILVHAYCSDFVIEKNKIVGAECIGIEVEGRLGGLKRTTVHPCRNATIRKNETYDCGGWGVLLMWADNVTVVKNKCFNSLGAFLSIGCTNVNIRNNMAEKKLNGTVIVTYRCNARCSMCNRYKAPSKAEEEISIETIKKLPKMYFTNITGGEPFIRTDLKEVVRELYKKSDRIVISTNGFFTDRIIDLCKEFPQIGIRISIEGLGKNQ